MKRPKPETYVRAYAHMMYADRVLGREIFSIGDLARWAQVSPQTVRNHLFRYSGNFGVVAYIEEETSKIARIRVTLENFYPDTLTRQIWEQGRAELSAYNLRKKLGKRLNSL